MAGNKKRSKKYVQKPQLPFGGMSLLAGRYVDATPITEEQVTGTLTDYYLALDAVIQGRATAAQADVLIYAVNVGYLLTELNEGMGKQHRNQLIKPAMLALHRMNERSETHGKYGLDGVGLQAMRAFAELHEQQLMVATQAELAASIVEMHKRVAARWVFTFELEE